MSPPKAPDYVCGNASSDEGVMRGWFIGHFLPPSAGLRRDMGIEVKWGTHRKGEQVSRPSLNQIARTLSLLISGEYEIGFPELEQRAVLSRPGDYVLYEPGLVHTGVALQDTIIVTIRWPSVQDDNVKTP